MTPDDPGWRPTSGGVAQTACAADLQIVNYYTSPRVRCHRGGEVVLVLSLGVCLGGLFDRVMRCVVYGIVYVVFEGT